MGSATSADVDTHFANGSRHKQTFIQSKAALLQDIAYVVAVLTLKKFLKVAGTNSLDAGNEAGTCRIGQAAVAGEL